MSRARVSVRESDQRICVTVEQDVLADGADLRGMRIALTPMRRTPIQTVSLNAPIAGRRIEGEGMSETPINSFIHLAITRPDGLQIPAVPSVIGLAPEDAIQVLSQQRFVAVLDGHGQRDRRPAPTTRRARTEPACGHLRHRRTSQNPRRLTQPEPNDVSLRSRPLGQSRRPWSPRRIEAPRASFARLAFRPRPGLCFQRKAIVRSGRAGPGQIAGVGYVWFGV